jgi:hypothetical protein
MSGLPVPTTTVCAAALAAHARMIANAATNRHLKFPIIYYSSSCLVLLLVFRFGEKLIADYVRVCRPNCGFVPTQISF